MQTVDVTLWSRSTHAQISLSRALHLFENAYRASGKSPRTVDWYRERLGYVFTFLQQELGREPTLLDFTREQFRLFILERRASGSRFSGRGDEGQPLSSSYIHGFYRAVRGFSSWLYREELIPINVMAALELPRLDERELQPLTQEEEIRLLNAYSGSKPLECRNKAIFILMLSTGLRRGELIGLKDSAVNLEEGFLTVWGKGKRQRSVPFGYKTGWLLQRYRSLYRPGPAVPTYDTFFLSLDGYPLTAKAMQMLFARARERTGILRLHPHLLRHTYGTRSAELGIPTLTLQRFMGHSQPTVTERYSHIAQNERIKRDRSYDHVDTLDIKMKRPRIR